VPKHVPTSPAKIVLSSGFHIEVNKDDGVRNMAKEELDKGLLATVAREVIFENRVIYQIYVEDITLHVCVNKLC